MLDEIDNIIAGEPDFERRVRLVAVKQLHDQQEELNAPIKQIKEKYAERLRSYRERINQLIMGAQPRPQEIVDIASYLKEGEQVQPATPIKNYWLMCISNSPLEAFTTEKDQRILQNLLNIEMVEPSQDSSVTFKFIFKPNQFMADEVPEYVRRVELDALGRAVSVGGDIPTWKVGKWPQFKVVKKTDAVSGKMKQMKGAKIDSFFDIFLDWSDQDNSRLMEKCARIFEVLDIIIEDSLNYFTGTNEEDEEDEQEDEQEAMGCPSFSSDDVDADEQELPPA